MTTDTKAPVEGEATIRVEVAYARPGIQTLLEIRVRPDSTIANAIASSGILDRHPEIVLTDENVGIFGKPASLRHPVKQGDRIEIYRPLLMDPLAARRARAQKR